MMVNVARYLPKSEAAVHIKRLVYKCLFNKVAGLQLKKDFGRDIFS